MSTADIEPIPREEAVPHRGVGLLRTVISAAALATLIVVIIHGYGYLRFGTVKWLGPVLRSEPLIVINPTQEARTEAARAPQVIEFAFFNLSSAPVKVLGYDTMCDCVSSDDMPVVLPPNTRGKINFRLAPTNQQQFTRDITLFTNNSAQPKIRLRIVGGS